MADRTEINAMVIDVKDDGQLSYEMDVPLAKDAHASLKMYNVDKVIATLNEHHIWPIARIACMRDTPLAKAHPELAVHGPDGQVWHDRSRHYWLNPYKKEVWDYNVDVALDAIKHGFKEIQFDYVRFPSEGKISTLQYPGKPAGSHRSDQITAFMKYAAEKIHAQGAWFSADVFGLTSTVERRYDRTHPQTGPPEQADTERKTRTAQRPFWPPPRYRHLFLSLPGANPPACNMRQRPTEMPAATCWGQDRRGHGHRAAVQRDGRLRELHVSDVLPVPLRAWRVRHRQSQRGTLQSHHEIGRRQPQTDRRRHRRASCAPGYRTFLWDSRITAPPR